MKKQAGLWIDHRKAVIVTLQYGTEEMKKIASTMEKDVGFKSEDGRDEDGRDRQFENYLNNYYDKVIAFIRDADSIHIFGLGEAKGEFEKPLEHEGVKTDIAVETVDKMTDGQILAKVHDYFKKSN